MHQPLKTVLTPLFCFLICVPAFAQSRQYDLAELIAMAIERNPELHASEIEASSLTARAEFGGLWEDPVLEFGYERSHQPINPPTGDTDFGRLSISQLVPRPGRLQARRETLHATSRVGVFESQLSKVELTSRVLQSAYGFKVANERWVHSRERVARIKTVDTFIRSRPFVSPQRQAEAVITRSKLAILEKQFRKFEADRVAAWNELRVYTGLEVEPELKLNWFKKAAALNTAEFLLKAESMNPEIRRRVLKVEAQKAQASLERADSWQGLTLTGAISDGAGANPERNFGLGIALPLPVANANRGAIRAAELLLTAEQTRLQWSRLRLKASVETALQKYAAASKSVEALSVENTAASEGDMAKIDQGFKRGQVELLTYLEADAQHFENFNEALESQLEFLTALSELSFLVGEAPSISEL
jgi:cobalt-zinc-cadmium efflux system outer membrane protein